jgi:hypothetical protein
MRRLAFVLFLLLGPEQVAFGHTPGKLSADKPFVVEDPTDSKALYGIFSTGDELFVVQVSYEERFAQPVELLVPHRDSLRAHRPAYAVVGPGLPPPTAEELAALPAPLPDGWGAVVDLNDVSPRPVTFESFTRRFFWSSGSLAVVFPQGASEIWVWSPQQTTGKFVIGFGVEEGGGYLGVFSNWSLYAY